MGALQLYVPTSMESILAQFNVQDEECVVGFMYDCRIGDDGQLN